jgi:hypothetical protein
MSLSTADALNRDCACQTLDRDALRRQLEADESLVGLADTLRSTRPNLFASTAVFLSTQMYRQMQEGIATIERVVRLPGYQARAIERAPQIARHSFGPLGVFTSYDFHLGPDGPRLIEINTNAGGALLNAALANAQQACCEALGALFAPAADARQKEAMFVEMFMREWRLQRGDTTPDNLLIIDDDPASQYLSVEFELFRRLFERHGMRSQVADPLDLCWRDPTLWQADVPVQMLYNRLTDFYLAEPAHAALRAPYEAGAVVLTPHPRAHALYADKRNLIALSDDELLAQWNVSSVDRALLSRIVPRTWLVTPENAQRLWAERRSLFFKPAGGHASKAAYRGDKLTRRVWGEILEGTYVAQTAVPPSPRLVVVDGVATKLKFDVRAYAYAGEVQLLAARVYAGQTTNFRTPGGGFSPAIVVP